MKYNELTQQIDRDINTNGNHGITGAKLNSVLNEMVSVLGDGFRIAGEILPSSEAPTDPENGLCYIAKESGVYENFGNIQVNDYELAFLYYYSSAWNKMGWSRKDFGLVVVNRSTTASFGEEEMEEIHKEVAFIVRNDADNVGNRLFVKDHDDPLEGTLFYAAPMLSSDLAGDLILKQGYLQVSATMDNGRYPYVTSKNEYNLPIKENLEYALSLKQDALTFDTTPTTSSTNPVTSGGIKNAIDNVAAVPRGGTAGQVLTKSENGYGWADSQGGGGVTDVTVGGTSVVSGGVAVVPAIPDITDCIQKSQTAGLVKNDGTIDTTSYGTYSKPSGGIPSTDLTSAVQTSLGKADTAVQSVTVGTITTGNAGTNASVTNSGTTQNPVLDFTIPRGQGITYKNAESVADLPTPSSSQSPYIYLIPSTTESGAVDQYACIKDAVVEGQVISGWSWVLVGTTAPIVSVQEVDTFQDLIAWRSMAGYRPTAGSGGNITTNTSNLNSYIYDIGEQYDKVYINLRLMPTGSTLYQLFYYDASLPSCAAGEESSACLGWDYNRADNPSSSAIVYTDQLITPPQGTRYVLIVTSGTYTAGEYNACKTSIIVTQSIIKKQTNPNEIYYFETIVHNAVFNGVSGNTEETTTETLSGWGVMFPTSYNNIGRPTPIIAMLHGNSGYVSPSVLGYPSNANWIAWRNQYLDAGFAVMDVNGYGVSISDDDYSDAYGNPQFVETLDKAFDYLRMNYNVCDKLLLHGSSMGGACAMSYLMQHPDKVEGVGLFAPALLPFSLRKSSTGSTSLKAWGYASAEDAEADNYSRIVGYTPMMESVFDWTAVNPSDVSPLSSFDAPTKLPNKIVRIWQGDNDTTVPYANTLKLVELLRKGNCNVTIRTCVGGTHQVSTGMSAYIRNEAVNWFKRFMN